VDEVDKAMATVPDEERQQFTDTLLGKLREQPLRMAQRLLIVRYFSIVYHRQFVITFI
jgi:hypothetical protein